MTPSDAVDLDRLRRVFAEAKRRLLESTADRRLPSGRIVSRWTGRLSDSALSTATAIAALELIDRTTKSTDPSARSKTKTAIERGVAYLVERQNRDGGWGDTDRSYSNVSTSMLATCSLKLVAGRSDLPANVDLKSARLRGADYVERAGGVEAIKRRYGSDHTFSVPILTHAALCGEVAWSEIPALPFELARLPHRFFQIISLPVVSYALPALIAIGQAIDFHRPSKNPVVRLIRGSAKEPTLEKLRAIQPASGGFLEATPLTAFVTMSLASIGRADHPVAVSGVEFLLASQREHGGWPIDTDLATWVTTLSINGLGDDLPEEHVDGLIDYLLETQYREIHPYTMAAPGGWAWTDLSGGVPDADDTPGALIALERLTRPKIARSNSADDSAERRSRIQSSAVAGLTWLRDLQNRDGGWPTFCRGWGKLPFDRSSPDITAHCLRAVAAWRDRASNESDGATNLREPIDPGEVIDDFRIERGFRFLARRQRSDGSWLPLWFGNQNGVDDENPTYGTAKALLAYRDWLRLESAEAKRAIAWLESAQLADGSWTGFKIDGSRSNQTSDSGVSPGSVEETALAVEALATTTGPTPFVVRGIEWLARSIEGSNRSECAPIGFYFAKLWYYEALYPEIFAVSALKSFLNVVAR